MKEKRRPQDLALFSGRPAFSKIRSTSNLAKPDEDRFFFYVKQSFDSHWMTNNGPMVQELEKRLANIHEVRHCVAFCNGFWAIALCMYELALKGKTEVIMPAMTYRRLADITAWVGLTPHFCDLDENTLSISVTSVERCINEKTALIMAAHPIVHICDIDGLTKLASRHGVPLLFDSVEASYASYKGGMIGSFGDAECFSMHASKLLNGFEGGYMTTNNTELAEKVSIARGFGFSGQDNVVALGLNAKLNEIHASMALASIDELQNQLLRNRGRYELYCELLEHINGIEIVRYNENEKRGYKNILVELTDSWPVSREETIQILHAENMLVRPYYNPPLHTRKTSYNTVFEDLPVAEYLTQRYMLLPSGEFVSHSDIRVISSVLASIPNMGRELLTELEKRRNERIQ